MLGKFSTAELHPQPCYSLRAFWNVSFAGSSLELKDQHSLMVSQAVGGTVNYFLVTLYEYPAAHVVKLGEI